ncbi:MAG TPA: hypothetical protein VMA97_09210 [Streptosporangiaceae bacterium]|nr:hypothetical protein [Streptosporangiaceae bacterium]
MLRNETPAAQVARRPASQTVKPRTGRRDAAAYLENPGINS